VDNLSARKADFTKFQELGVQILGISENNPFSQKTLADSLKLPYPLLSDRTLEVTKRYGVLYGSTPGKIDYPHMVGRMAKRAFFLVDRDGIVRGRWIGEDLAVFPSGQILKAAQDLKGKP
jgi:glutaredoxin-dependent peroxiredoxin